jgi:hypothetical protein
MAAPLKKDHQIPKYIVSLTYFANHSMNRVEAQSLYGDTYLNTTVSSLRIDHGIAFNQRVEPHFNQGGRTVRFTRYWLADDSRERVIQLIRRYLPNFQR